MSTKWYGLLFCGTVVSLLALSACAPALVGGASAIGDATETTMAENASVLVEGSDAPVTVAGSASDEQGGSGPGAAEGDTNTEPGVGAAPAAPLVTYTDQTYKFSVDYPSNFEVRPAPAPDLQALSPTPSASFLFLSPSAASSDVVEPADLEIRVYAAGGEPALESWVASSGFGADFTTPEPFKTANVSGVKVCAATMIAPGCSYVVLANGWAYSLTPSSQAGEAMIETFKLLP